MISSVTCIFCTKARQYMTEHRIPFEECLIERDPACLADYKRLGASGTPTLLMSFANIEPLTLSGAGGLLLTDATGTAATTSLTLTDIGAQTQIVGNGGFAPTTFSGFNAAVVVGGGGAETLDVVSLDNATLTSVTL